MRIIIATIKSWNIERAMRLKQKYDGQHEIIIYTKKEELTSESVSRFNPDYILFRTGHIIYLMR